MMVGTYGSLCLFSNLDRLTGCLFTLLTSLKHKHSNITLWCAREPKFPWPAAILCMLAFLILTTSARTSNIQTQHSCRFQVMYHANRVMWSGSLAIANTATPPESTIYEIVKERRWGMLIFDVNWSTSLRHLAWALVEDIRCSAINHLEPFTIY